MNGRSAGMTKNALTFLPAKVAEGLITMATTSLYTSRLTPGAYGDYQLVNTNVLFCHLVAICWLLNAAVRYVGDGREDESARRRFFSTVGCCYLLFAVLAAGLGFAAGAAGGGMVWKLGGVMLASYSLFQIANGLLVQEGKVIASVVLSLSSASVKLAGVNVYIRLLPGGETTAAPALAAAVTADLCAGVVAVLALRVPRWFSPGNFSKELLRVFFRFGLPLVGFSISVGLLNMADKYLVKYMKGGEAFAYYSANNSISTGLFTLFNVGVMRGVYPALLAAWRGGGQEEAKPLLDRGARLYMLLAVPAAAGLFAVGPAFARLFFARPEYHEGQIISIAALSMLMMGLTEYANKGWELTSHTLPILQNSLIAAAVKVAATAALIPPLGITGAAVGSLIAFTSYFLLSRRRAKKLFTFSVPAGSAAKIIGSAVLCAAAARGVLRIMENRPLFAMVCAVAAGAAVYGVSILLTGEAKEELAALRARRGGGKTSL